jgi:putative ABC transport system substrate-binding protein
MKRREFITLLGGAAAAWPLAAHAQQPDRTRRVGVLTSLAAEDAEARLGNAALLQGLQQRGGIVGRNLRIDYRFGAGKSDDIRKHAAELAALAPDVIVAGGSAVLTALRQFVPAVPIVLISVADPVGAGFVESLARPGGNATGFLPFEYSLAGKWPALLKEIAPNVTRAAVLRDSDVAAGAGQLGAIQSVASTLGMELRPVGVRDAGEIERGLAAFANGSNGGLIVTGSASSFVHSKLIITLAANYRLPAIYFNRLHVAAGGLMSYGPDLVDQYRGAAGYVDRILKGDKPADLPVQAPTKYELVLNLKMAKALGLTVPATLLATADEVIE